MVKPTVLVISNTVSECLVISELFVDLVQYIDYEIDISNITDYEHEYDIFIYDYDNLDLSNGTFCSDNAQPVSTSALITTDNMVGDPVVDHDGVIDKRCNIVLTSSTDDVFISNLIDMDTDIIVVQKKLNRDIVKHLLFICSMICKQSTFCNQTIVI
jgi:hypothetical protein